MGLGALLRVSSQGQGMWPHMTHSHPGEGLSHGAAPTSSAFRHQGHVHPQQV